MTILLEVLTERYDGLYKGLSRERIEEWVMSVCRDKVRPEPIPHFELVRDIEPGKDIAIVRVGRSWAVHDVWHNNHRSYYVRVGWLAFRQVLRRGDKFLGIAKG